VKIIIIAAVANNGVIGNKNQLIWHLPNDLKRFKALTTGHTIVMGRKTFESLGRPLPRRENIVLTHQKEWKKEGIKVFHTKRTVLDYTKEKEKIFIIGGAEIYQLFLNEADILEITYVDTKAFGDAHFPTINYKNWKLVREFLYEKDEKHIFSYKFATYQRKMN